MPHYLDLDTWPRRPAFDYFREFDNPYFDITAPVDVTELRLAAKAQGIPFSHAVLYLAMRVANEYEPFRYRLEKGRVLVHDRIHGSTTTLLGDERLAFLYFEYNPDLSVFLANLKAGRENLDSPPAEMDPRWDRSDMIHFSWLPWVPFTSISHPRKWGREDSVPKITFGKYEEVGERLRMPVSVTAHHALMDGLHAGRYFEKLQTALDQPEWLSL
jgi:chloramphenicol O-acetyltransferase type A